MEFKRANRLYCLGNEEENDESVKIGILKSTEKYSIYFHSFNLVAEPEEVLTWSTEKSLLFLFSHLDFHFEYIDTYINITEQELTFGRLAVNRSRFCFLDSSKKHSEINKLSKKVNDDLLLIQIAAADQFNEQTENFQKNKPIYLDQLNKFCLN
jgi:hypothetical protein